MFFRGLILLIVVMIAMHTASYGLWALRQGNRRGAVGTFVLAGAVVLAPIVVWATAP